MSDLHSPHERPTVMVTVGLIIGAAVFISIFFGLNAVMEVGTPHIGLLFILYWAAILQQNFQSFVPSLIGGLTGLLIGWALVGLPQLVGIPGTVFSYIVLIIALFCFMRHQITAFFNNSTMLFLLISTIPELNISNSFLDMGMSLLLAAGYIGSVAWFMQIISRRNARNLSDVDAI